MALDAQEAVDPLISALEKLRMIWITALIWISAVFLITISLVKRKPGHGYDEINDPSPRYKEVFIRALGVLKAERAALPVLTDYLNNDRNALEIPAVAAGLALADIASPAALKKL